MLLRRCFLGAVVRDTDEGVEVTRVLPGSMAARAGLLEGDIIVGFGGETPDRAALIDACRARAGDETTLVFTRDAERLEARVDYVPFPNEVVPGAEVVYGESGPHRVILATPAGADTVVCFLPGIGYASVDFALREAAPAARFLADLCAHGLATFRVERPGLGDSPGAPCVGFHHEQRIYRDAFERLGGFSKRVIFGHSVGGMHAPMLADLADALVVYGTSRRRWSTCLSASRERQSRLRGVGNEGRDEWPAERATRFHEELDALDLPRIWDEVPCPWLVAIGEHDWVVGEDEQRELGGEALRLEGLDHAFTRHASLEESLNALGRGTYDDRLARGCAAWIRATLGA